MNHYKLLGINYTASPAEIKKAYYFLAKKYHPDLNSSEEAEGMFKKISLAYQVLSDSDLRRSYDWSLRLTKPKREVRSKRNVSNIRSVRVTIVNGKVVKQEIHEEWF